MEDTITGLQRENVMLRAENVLLMGNTSALQRENRILRAYAEELRLALEGVMKADEKAEMLEFRLSHAWDALQRGAWDELEIALNPENTAQKTKFVAVMKQPWTKGRA
jgi:hypothetical protein